MTAKKIFIKSFGCQMNEYDSNRIVDLMTDSSGYIKTNSAEDADLVILNTCSIRDKAQQKVYSELGRIRTCLLYTSVWAIRFCRFTRI